MTKKMPEAQRIQMKITVRLESMKDTGANSDDIEFLYIWSHKLYELAKNLTKQRQKLQEKFDKIKTIIEKD